MESLHRKLLLLLPEDLYGEVAIAHEASCLHKMLDKVDMLAHTVDSVEYLNLHRGGITQNKLRIENVLQHPALGPFQFILYKN